jgi:hypothetical protein
MAFVHGDGERVPVKVAALMGHAARRDEADPLAIQIDGFSYLKRPFQRVDFR